MAEIFNKPNRSGKRFRKTCHTVPLTNVLSKIKAKHSKYKSLTLDQMRDVVHGFSTFLTEKAISHREGIELPEGLGTVLITSFKTTKRLIDKATSEKLGIKVYHNNLITDGFMMKIFYSNDRMRYKLPNREMWGLKGVREFRELASKSFKDDWKKYIQLEIRKKEPKPRYSMIERTPLIDPEENYNEFDI